MLLIVTIKLYKDDEDKKVEMTKVTMTQENETLITQPANEVAMNPQSKLLREMQKLDTSYNPAVKAII